MSEAIECTWSPEPWQVKTNKTADSGHRAWHEGQDAQGHRIYDTGCLADMARITECVNAMTGCSATEGAVEGLVNAAVGTVQFLRDMEEPYASQVLPALEDALSKFVDVQNPEEES